MSENSYDKRLLSIRRSKLKQRIYKERAEWTMDGAQPLCAICEQPPERGEALQMHETFITRGDVSGNKELLYAIMNECNCVLVHANCHKYANSKYAKRKCAENVLLYEGSSSVIMFLEAMSGTMRTDTPSQSINLVKEVLDEM